MTNRRVRTTGGAGFIAYEVLLERLVHARVDGEVCV